MKNIIEKFVAAISNIVVLFGGEAIEYDSTYVDSIVSWFDSIGIHFAD